MHGGAGHGWDAYSSAPYMAQVSDATSGPESDMNAAIPAAASALPENDPVVSDCNARQRPGCGARFLLSDTGIIPAPKTTTTEDCTMKKVIATLIAGLFATAAFAQAPAAPAASVPAKAEAAHTKAVVKADAKETTAAVKADAKVAKTEMAASADVASAKADAAATKAKAHHKAKKAKAKADEKLASATAAAAPAPAK